LPDLAIHVPLLARDLKLHLGVVLDVAALHLRPDTRLLSLVLQLRHQLILLLNVGFLRKGD
jgi:hypothetical protein